MCGRYANSNDTAGLYRAFDVQQAIADDLAPSWNIAPTDPIRAIVQRIPDRLEAEQEDLAPIRQLRTVRWGLVPSWAKEKRGAAGLINARSETVLTKPTFRKAAALRRALLPADGYYEWRKTPQGKVPYYLHSLDGSGLAFAGLYELWPDPALQDDDPAKWLWTATVITRAAPAALAEIHHRCPVIVPPEMQGAWLDCSSGESAVVAQLLQQIPPPVLVPRVVSFNVNNMRNNGPQLIEPADWERPVPLF